MQVFFCEFCGICKKTIFAEHLQTFAPYQSSLNSREGELANKTVDYDTEIKMQQFEPEVGVMKKKESGTCFGTTISDTYQCQLKKSNCYRKNQYLSDNFNRNW